MSITLSEPPLVDRSPLDAAEHTFQLVASTPSMVVNGRALSPELPQQLIALTELRDLLVSRATSNDTRDVVWRELVTRARQDGPQWLVAAVGLALPLLRGISGQICHDYVAGEPADIDTEILARFIEAVRTADLAKPNVLPRMRDAAKHAGQRARQLAESDAARRFPLRETAQPKAPWGHPDLVLADAVDKGVINRLDAELIGLTRLERRTLAEAADILGLTGEGAKKRRQRAEAVLVKAVLDGEVESALSLTITSDLPRKVEEEIPPSPARSRITSDPQPCTTTEPKGGRGTPIGSARTPTHDLHHAHTRPLPLVTRPRCALRTPVVVALVVLIIVGMAVAALADPASAGQLPARAAPADLNTVFTNIRNWLIGLLVSLATLMLTIGGLRYLVAGGDPGEIQKAKAALKAAAFGYGLAVLAPLFVNVLKSVVGG